MRYEENLLRYDEYDRIRDSVGWAHFSEEQAQRALNNSLFTIAARDGGRTVGMGRLLGDGLYYVVVDVAVIPEYQGQGIGGEILARLLAYSESNIPIGGRASVQLIAEKGKEAFYEKFGFKKIPHEHCGTGMRKILRRVCG